MFYNVYYIFSLLQHQLFVPIYFLLVEVLTNVGVFLSEERVAILHFLAMVANNLQQLFTFYNITVYIEVNQTVLFTIIKQR